MNRFKPGQQVVCIRWRSFRHSDSKIPAPTDFGPKYGEIVTVACYAKPTSIRLVEYPLSYTGCPASFAERVFMPLMDISELESLLHSIPETESV